MRPVRYQAVLLSLFVFTGTLPAKPHAHSIPIFSFGPAGMGSDDTATFQTALNWAASRGETLEIPAGVYNVGPLNLPTNTALRLDANVVVQAISGYGPDDRLLTIEDAQNISITGTPGLSIFQMLKPEYTSGEFRHCLGIYGATNVQISGIQCNNSGGDGIYIGEGIQGYSANVQVTKSGFNNNRRQGMSLVSGQNVIVSECTFTNTSGTAPSDGLDIEPNGTTDLLSSITVQNSSASGNDGNGIVFAVGKMNATSVPISVNLSGFTSQSNHQSGFFASNEQDGAAYSVPGRITVTNSTSYGDGQYGAIASYWEAGGTTLFFQTLTIINPNRSRTNIDNAAITVKRGGGATHLMGNVHFYGTAIIDTLGEMDVFFSIYDFSHVGITQLQFLDPFQLSGAHQGTGLMDGVPALILNVN